MNAPRRMCAVLLAAALVGLAGCASPGGTSFFDDASTTAKVKQAIYNDPSLKVMNISVSTEDSVVSLSGTVKTRTERARAIQAARKVEGVKRVKDELKIEK
jgi:osmotically-inducible protein OsmY